MDDSPAPWQSCPMSRADRLFQLIQILRDGRVHRARELAARLGVSPRTIYRDMDRLAQSGIPVHGEPGSGYHMRQAVTLPPLTLETAELEALNLGIAIVAEADDPVLSAAARSLAEKVDAIVPVRNPDRTERECERMLHLPASSARVFSHMGLLRSAIRGRQKLRLAFRDGDGRLLRRTVRPLQIDCWGRIWTLVAWCEQQRDFRVLRVDLIEEATALPELFVDEPGRTLEDFRTRPAAG